MTDILAGHNAPCVMCGKPCSVLTGNPAMWPIQLDDERWRHIGCVRAAVDERDFLRARVKEIRKLTVQFLRQHVTVSVFNASGQLLEPRTGEQVRRQRHKRRQRNEASD